MENKYYTPAIEDLRVGYECEHTTDTLTFKVNNTDEIIKDKLYSHDVVNYLKWIIENNHEISEFIRTPYLTKEQIEAEGWKSKTEYTGKFRFVFEKGNSWLAWNPEENMMTIMPIDPSKEFYEHNVRYAGGCPSINEFRQICKLLDS